MRKIFLTQGLFTIVDDNKYEWLMQWKWYAHKSNRSKDTYYAYRSKRGKNGEVIAMHRELLGLTFGDKEQVDHRNHNGLDNRIDNIWKCTRSQNIKNRKQGEKGENKATSKYVGVCWHKRDQKWRASIKFENRTTYLGSFNNEIEAAKAYDKKANELLGELANYNFKQY